MRILLLTLYYPPLNTIAASRMKAFEKELIGLGHEVDVITRYYDEEQQKGESMFLGGVPPKDFKTDYIRKQNIIYTNFDDRNPKLSFSLKLPPLVRGIYNYANIDVFHYGWISYVMNAFEKELRSKGYDYIISSYGPPIILRLAKEMSEKYKIPYVIDFRDAFINETDRGIHLILKKIVQNKVLKNASALIFSTKGMAEYFQKNASSRLLRIPACNVYNGIDNPSHDVQYSKDDQFIVEEFNSIRNRHTLVLLHTGTLYKGQNISFFIDGVEKYNDKNKYKVAIVFLGLAENNHSDISKYPSLYFLPKVKHNTSLFLQKQCSALLLPVWNGRYTGFSGKTQEYLFSENIVITSPDPQEDLKEFLNISPNVYIASDSEMFLTLLSNIIDQTLVKRSYENKEKLFRSYWIEKLSEFLNNLK